jgi:pimeloyl-ACP methyl ester carboxylesterase
MSAMREGTALQRVVRFAGVVFRVATAVTLAALKETVAFFGRLWKCAGWWWLLIIGVVTLVFFSPMIWWYTFGYHSEPASGKPEGVYLLAGSEAPDRRGDVILVHGLEGDYRSTWKATRSDFFWPDDLANLGGIGVWSVQYGAAATDWAGNTLPLTERSTNFLRQLVQTKLGKTNTVFVVHSLGGLVVKQAFNSALTMQQSEWEEIVDNTEAVVFLATPHTGSGLASYMQRLGWAVRPSVTLNQLQRDDADLRNLNIWYRNNIPGRGIRSEVFYEKKKIGHLWWSQLVVEEGSADLGVNGVVPTPVPDANHFTICKPKSEADFVYVSIRDIVNKSISPGNPSYDITLPDFMKEYDRVKKNYADLQKFREAHVGQKVRWTAQVKFNHRPQPTLGVSAPDDNNGDHRVTAVFLRGLFPDVSVGNLITIQGTISPNTDDQGVILLKCRQVK